MEIHRKSGPQTAVYSIMDADHTDNLISKIFTEFYLDLTLTHEGRESIGKHNKNTKTVGVCPHFPMLRHATPRLVQSISRGRKSAGRSTAARRLNSTTARRQCCHQGPGP